MANNMNFKGREYKCCICGKRFVGYGNDPWPVNMEKNAKCCNGCNKEVVIPARLIQLANANGGKENV